MPGDLYEEGKETQTELNNGGTQVVYRCPTKPLNTGRRFRAGNKPTLAHFWMARSVTVLFS